MSGANQCVKSGTNTKSGQMTTPEFHVDSVATFSFEAAPFGNDGTTLTLHVNGTASISPTTFTLRKGQWTHCEAIIDGCGTITVDITPQKRMFLDEIKAIAVIHHLPGDATGDGVVDIADVNAVINIMLGKANIIDAADVNGDGEVDIADVNAVINIMLGKQ